MRRWLRRVLALGIGVALLGAALLASRWASIGQERGPGASGELLLAGLGGPVSIVRDPFGVPHVDATRRADAFLGLGVAHAQDRLWQMEMLRRAATGRLAEVFGRPALASDRLSRLLGFAAEARAELPELGGRTRRLLEAYCAGINGWLAHLAAGEAPVPLELRWLELEPEPWTPADVLAIVRWRAWSTSRSLGASLLLDRLVRELGGVGSRDFFPARAHDGALGALGDALLELGRSADQLAHLGAPPGPVGSLGAVVSSGRSASDGALLLNDPHVSFGLPATFYLAHLRAPDLELGGATWPGVPVFHAGTNGRIAWGRVALHASVSDLYDETFHPGDRQRYERGGRWRRVEVRTETIAVRGEQAVEVEIRRTRNGPLLDAALPDAERAPDLALRWAGRGEPSGIEALLALQRAGDWEAFRGALRGLAVPPATFLYAHRDGSIGAQLAGRLPVRAIETGLLPVTGGSQYYTWRGFIEFDDLPSEHGSDVPWIIATTHPDHASLAQRVAWLWSSPGGAARLRDALSRPARLDLDALVELQRERVSSRGPAAVRVLLGDVVPTSRAAARVRDALLAWDGAVDVSSRGAALYHVFRARLAGRLLAEHAGDGASAAVAAVADPAPGVALSRALDRMGPERSDALVEHALEDTWSHMRHRVSSNPAKWTWGRTQRLRLQHAFERHGRGLLRAVGRRLGRGPFPAPGDPDAIWAMYAAELPTDDVGVGPALRLAVDMSDWRHLRVGLAGGQSGHAGDAHYDDALRDWLEGRARPLWLHWGDVAYHRTGAWELRPPPVASGG